MSIWDGLGGAPTFERGTFFNAGSIHDVQINRMLCKQSQQSGLGLIVETDILSSASSGEINPQTHAPWIPLPVGSQGTWWQGMTDRNVAMPAVKGFLCAVLGLEPGDPRRAWLEQTVQGSERWQLYDPITNRVFSSGRPIDYAAALMAWATSEANTLQGMFVHLDTRMTKTRKNTDFTIHNWTIINYASVGLAPPDVGAILTKVSNQPPLPVQGQAPPPPPPPQAWAGQPQGAPPGSFQPAPGGQSFQPQGAPPGPGWGPSSASHGQPPGYGAPPLGPTSVGVSSRNVWGGTAGQIPTDPGPAPVGYGNQPWTPRR